MPNWRRTIGDYANEQENRESPDLWILETGEIVSTTDYGLGRTDAFAIKAYGIV